MSIPSNQFSPKPGLINKEGFLPDPLELVCIEAQKVFDQCLVKRCLKYKDGPDTDFSDEELRSNPLPNAKIFVRCRDFNIKLLSFDKTPLKNHDGYNKVVINFLISFYADYIDNMGNNMSELFEINRSETISRLYCPDSIAKSSSSIECDSENFNTEFLKLELVADCLDGTFVEGCNGCIYLDITLGFHLIVKCELLVQLLIPAYGYCPVPKPCRPIPTEDPCRRFNRSAAPKFYPDQKLRPLFEDDDCDDICDCDDDCDDICNCDEDCNDSSNC